jgi:hypothetical protein
LVLQHLPLFFYLILDDILGQIKKTQRQIQNELDEIHTLLANGASDQHIMKTRQLERPTFYRYKKRLYKQVARMYENKRLQDYYYDIQLCKERLTTDRVNAAAKANETNNPLWGQLAAEIAVSLLKLEAEGITAITQNGHLRSLEQKTGHIQYDGPRSTLPATEPVPDPGPTNPEEIF